MSLIQPHCAHMGARFGSRSLGSTRKASTGGARSNGRTPTHLAEGLSVEACVASAPAALLALARRARVHRWPSRSRSRRHALLEWAATWGLGSSKTTISVPRVSFISARLENDRLGAGPWLRPRGSLIPQSCRVNDGRWSADRVSQIGARWHCSSHMPGRQASPACRSGHRARCL